MNAKQRRTRQRHTRFMIKRVEQIVEQSVEKTYQHFKKEVPKKVMLEIGDRVSKIIRKQVIAEIMAMPKRTRPAFRAIYRTAKQAWKRTITASWKVIMTRRERKETRARGK